VPAPEVSTHAECGFTLIELMVVVAAVAILATIAYPSYAQYIFRSRAIEGTNALAALAVRLEQRFQDVGGYGTGVDGHTDGNCGMLLSEPPNFSLACITANGGATFLATATGSGPVAGLSYTIDHNGVRKTPSHPRGTPAGDCWSLRGGVCDS
jgi:type IV pilus assembly protein PilE